MFTEFAAATLAIVGMVATVGATMPTMFGEYMKPNLDREADTYVNTAIDLGMVEYDHYFAYIQGWGAVWITNHPYGSGGIMRMAPSCYSSTGSRIRYRTTRRLLKDRKRRGPYPHHRAP